MASCLRSTRMILASPPSVPPYCASGLRCRSAGRRGRWLSPSSAHRTRDGHVSVLPARDHRATSALAPICSCSTAAAPNVSPAAMTARKPCFLYDWASLPIVVVLPVPLTPTTGTTCGLRAGSSSERSGDRGEDRADFLGQRLLDLLVRHFFAKTGAAEGGNTLRAASVPGRPRSEGLPVPQAPRRPGGVSLTPQ